MLCSLRNDPVKVRVGNLHRTAGVCMSSLQRGMGISGILSQDDITDFMDPTSSATRRTLWTWHIQHHTVVAIHAVCCVAALLCCSLRDDRLGNWENNTVRKYVLSPVMYHNAIHKPRRRSLTSAPNHTHHCQHGHGRIGLSTGTG